MDVYTDMQLYADALLEDVNAVDVAETTAKLSTIEAQLEASYQSVTMLSKLSLLNFL